MSVTQRRRNRRGFTLMEVLLVLVILVILGSLVGVYVTGAQKSSLKNSAKTQMGFFKEGITNFGIHMRRLPSTDEGLAALVSVDGVNNPKRWEGPYLEQTKVPLDPWDNEYKYELLSSEVYQITSFGPDGQAGGGDDIILRSDQGFITDEE